MSSMSDNTSIDMLSHRAVPGSRNPFLTPLGRLRLNSPPHLNSSPSPFDTQRPNTQIQVVPSNSFSSSSDEEQSTAHTSRDPRHCYCSPSPDVYENPAIKEKTMAGIPPWPADLQLSLNTNNWLEWLHQLINSLEMGQLNIYPLGLLKCPNH